MCRGQRAKPTRAPLALSAVRCLQGEGGRVNRCHGEPLVALVGALANNCSGEGPFGGGARVGPVAVQRSHWPPPGWPAIAPRMRAE
eukprot:6364977-Pyramimonas_sp.AAC.1